MNIDLIIVLFYNGSGGKMINKIIGPKISNCLESTNFEKLKDEEVITGFYFKNEVIEFDIDKYLEINGCFFENCQFINFNSNLHLTDVVFKTCDLSNMKLYEGSFTRCSFKECRLMGSNIVDAFLENVLFEDCLLTYINIFNTKVKNVNFKDCDLKDSSFKVEYKNLNFDCCNLANSEFQEMEMKDIDLANSDIKGIALNPRKINGMIVNSEQALAMALMLGIVIKA